jgi:hypothetical protein
MNPHPAIAAEKGEIRKTAIESLGDCSYPRAFQALIDPARITPQVLEEIVSNLDDMTIEVDGKDKVRIFCE